MRIRIDGIVHATRFDLIANPYQNIPEFYVTCGAASRAVAGQSRDVSSEKLEVLVLHGPSTPARRPHQVRTGYREGLR